MHFSAIERTARAARHDEGQTFFMGSAKKTGLVQTLTTITEYSVICFFQKIANVASTFVFVVVVVNFFSSGYKDTFFWPRKKLGQE